MAANMSWTRRRQQAAQHEARTAPSSDLFVLEHVDGYHGVRPCHACPFHALIGEFLGSSVPCCKVFSKETHFFLQLKLELKALIFKLSMHWPFRQVVFHVMSNARDRNVFPQLVGSFDSSSKKMEPNA